MSELCYSYVIRDLRSPGMLRVVDWWLAVQTAWPLNMGPIGCPDASVIASLRCVTSQKSDDHIYVHRGRSQRSCKLRVILC